MKKAILTFLISGLLTGFSDSQNLLDIYKKGPVKLIPDKTFGANNNWESLFNLYFDTLNIMEGEREEYKRIIVAPDGSVFMSHKNRYEIWKFGTDGNFVKKFGTKGGKASQFPYLPSVEPVVDGKYVFTTDANARLKFFDLDGNYFKSITLDYMTFNFRPLISGEILIYGKVLWKTRWRNIIVRLNIYSGEEKIIYEYFEDRSIPPFLEGKNIDSLVAILTSHEHKIRLPAGSGFRDPNVTLIPDGQFMLSDSESGQIKVFDIEGKEKNKFKLEITPITITEKDVLENFEMTKLSFIKAIEGLKNNPKPTEYTRLGLLFDQKMLDKVDFYKDINHYSPYLPYFSNIILDDEGNFLVFEFTGKDETESNIFNVIAYDKMGQKLARTSFTYVYAVAKLKNSTGIPLRLVKFKISN
jgi:WD40 repeat protein